MKKLIVLFCLVNSFGLLRAQRFFYVENVGITGNLVKNGLLKASQFITQSALSSDYIVRTELSFTEGDNILTVQINLQDTASMQTIFQGKETMAFGEFHTSPRVMLNTVIRAFIDKNIGQIITCARENHFDDQSKCLRIRKDKT